MKKILSAFFLSALLSAPAFAAIETKAREAIILDDATGVVLMEKEADTRMPPSSMSKLMTAYAVFKRLKEGSVKLTDEFVVSEKAWRTGGSKMFIHVGDYVKLEDLLRGMVIQSGNDACVAIAEGISGTEEAFAGELNKDAAELGLTASHFVNATGLPDPEHYMTARDLSMLARRIIHDFPEYYHYFSELEFTYNNIKQGNRNPLLYGNTLGVDGLKTGHTEMAGYGVVASGINARDGRRVIVVINGTASMQARADEARALMTQAYLNFENLTVAAPGQALDELPVWMGQAPKVAVGVKDPIIFTLPRGQLGKVKATVKAQSTPKAPIRAGDEIAQLVVEVPGQEPRIVPLVALQPVAALSGLQRIVPNLNHLIFRGQ